MQQLARMVPVKSKEGLVELLRQANERPAEERHTFFSRFGDSTVERWYYQEIDGKPYVLAVAEGEHLMDGFAQYPELDDPYFNWFRDRVFELSGVDLRAVPTAAHSELLGEVGVP